MHDLQKSTTSFFFDAYVAVNWKGFRGANRKNVSRHLSTFADKRWMQFMRRDTRPLMDSSAYIKAQTVQPTHHIANKSLKAGKLQAVKQAPFKIGISNETTGFSDCEKVRQGSVHAIRHVCKHTFLSVCRRAVHRPSIWDDSWKTVSPKQPSKQQLGFVELMRAIPAPLCWYCDLMSSLSRVVSKPSSLMFLPFHLSWADQTVVGDTVCGNCANVTAFVQEDRCGVNLYAECVRRYKFAVIHSLLSHLVAAWLLSGILYEYVTEKKTILILTPPLKFFFVLQLSLCYPTI